MPAPPSRSVPWPPLLLTPGGTALSLGKRVVCVDPDDSPDEADAAALPVLVCEAEPRPAGNGALSGGVSAVTSAVSSAAPTPMKRQGTSSYGMPLSDTGAASESWVAPVMEEPAETELGEWTFGQLTNQRRPPVCSAGVLEALIGRPAAAADKRGAVEVFATSAGGPKRIGDATAPVAIFLRRGKNYRQFVITADPALHRVPGTRSAAESSAAGGSAGQLTPAEGPRTPAGASRPGSLQPLKLSGSASVPLAQPAAQTTLTPLVKPSLAGPTSAGGSPAIAGASRSAAAAPAAPHPPPTPPVNHAPHPVGRAGGGSSSGISGAAAAVLAPAPTATVADDEAEPSTPAPVRRSPSVTSFGSSSTGTSSTGELCTPVPVAGGRTGRAVRSRFTDAVAFDFVSDVISSVLGEADTAGAWS